MNFKALAGLAAVAAAVCTVPAGAVTFNVGDTATVNFNGLADVYLGGVVAVPGLTSSLELTLDSIVGNTANFIYTLSNTSTAPITESRISVFGFDVGPAGFASAVGSSPFDIEVLGGDLPNVGGIERTLDVCFKTGGGAGNCNGGGGGGVLLGGSQAGTLALTFGGIISSVDLSDFHVRYQSWSNPELGVSGGSGVGDATSITTGVVPEPATWAMLIAGFGMVGMTMRKRRSTMARVSA